MNGQNTDLSVICADDRIHADTCDYWYLVRNGTYAHTAFNKRTSLIKWLDERGLNLADELSEHGTFKVVRVIGTYRQLMHWSYDEFFAMDDGKNLVSRTLSNGDYTMSIITVDPDGIRTVHTLNPNCKNRPKYDHSESRGLMG